MSIKTSPILLWVCRNMTMIVLYCIEVVKHIVTDKHGIQFLFYCYMWAITRPSECDLLNGKVNLGNIADLEITSEDSHHAHSFPSFTSFPVIPSAIMRLQHYPTGPGRTHRPGYQVRPSSADSRGFSRHNCCHRGLFWKGLAGLRGHFFSTKSREQSELYIQPPTS